MDVNEITDWVDGKISQDEHPRNTFELKSFDDIDEEDIEWLWEGRIALGKFNLWGGNAGLNKSTLTLDIAARVTTGSTFPDGSPCPVGDVIIMSTEDGEADTIKPRLRLAGADMKRVHTLTMVPEGENERLFSFAKDANYLEGVFKAYPSTNLVIADPASGFTEGLGNSFSDSEVRSMMAPITLLLNEYKVAMIGLTHLNKNEGASIIHRFTGAQAWVNVSRATFLIDRDPEDDNKRVFLPAKVNIAGDSEGYTFSTRIEDGHPVVEWGDAIQMRADQLGESQNSSKVDEAIEWLEHQLESGGLQSKELKKLAIADGISWRTLNRAKTEMGVTSGKLGYKRGWGWKLPTGHFNNSPEECQTSSPNLASFDENQQIREDLAQKNHPIEECQTTKSAKVPLEDGILRQTPHKHSLITTNNTSLKTEECQISGIGGISKGQFLDEGEI